MIRRFAPVPMGGAMAKKLAETISGALSLVPAGALGYKAETRGARIAAGTALRSIAGWHIVGRVSFGLFQNFIKPV